MGTIAEPRAPLPLLRYAGAAVLMLISAACLTLSYTHEGRFGSVLRIAFELGLPWVVAQLLTHRSYWLRVVFSYVGVVVTGVILILILPYVEMFLMDAGLM